MAVLTTLGAGVRPPCASDRYTMSDRGRIADFPPGLVGDGQKYSTRSHPSNPLRTPILCRKPKGCLGRERARTSRDLTTCTVSTVTEGMECQGDVGGARGGERA